MLKNLSKHLPSLEDSGPALTESPDLAEALVKHITEQDQSNEEVLAKKEAIIENASAQADAPFSPEAVTDSDVDADTGLSDDVGGDTETPDDTVPEDGLADTAVEDNADLSTDTDGDETLEAEVEDESTDLDKLDADTAADDTAEESDDIDSEETDIGETDDDGDTAGDGTELDEAKTDASSDSDDTTEEADDGEADDSDGDEESEEAGELEIEDVDLATTEGDVEEAETTADEEEEEADEEESEIIDDSKTLEELDTEAESLEEYIGLMRVAVESKSEDPIFMAAVNLKLTKLKDAFGKHAPRTPSLENYEANEAGDYYAFALESAEGFLGKIKSLGASIKKSIDDRQRKVLVSRVVPRATALNKKADLLLSRLTGVKENPTVSLKVKGIKTTETDLVKAIVTDLKNLTLLGGKRLGDIEAIYSEVVNIFSAIDSSGGPGKTGKITERGLKLKPMAFKEFSTQGSFVTGHFFKQAASPKTKGEQTSLLQQTRGHVSGLIPTLEKGAITDGVSTFDLDKNNLIRLVTICKAYLAMSKTVLERSGLKVEQINAKLGKDLVTILNKDYYRFDESDVGDLDEAYAPHGIVSGLKFATKNYGVLYRFTATHGIVVADMLLAAAEKATSKL